MKGKIFYRPEAFDTCEACLNGDHDNCAERCSCWQEPEPVDITESIQVLYDLVISSTDFGSGFLSVEDARPIVKLAELCGFEDYEVVKTYVDAQEHSLEQERFLQALPARRQHDHYFRHLDLPLDNAMHSFDEAVQRALTCQYPNCNVKEGSPEHLVHLEAVKRYNGEIPHDHVFSSVGKCMWPRCSERNDSA